VWINHAEGGPIINLLLTIFNILNFPVVCLCFVFGFMEKYQTLLQFMFMEIRAIFSTVRIPTALLLFRRGTSAKRYFAIMADW
jgi:hypothetical protein